MRPSWFPLFAVAVALCGAACLGTGAGVADCTCGANELCYEGSCRLLCNRSAECSALELCVGGLCSPRTGGAECGTDADCPDATDGNAGLCQEGQCVDTGNKVAPLVTLLAPTAGEIFRGGSTRQVEWIAVDDASPAEDLEIELAYSLNGALPVALAGALPNSGGVDWVVPSLDSANVRLVVRARDLAGNVGTATSDEVVIDSTPPALSSGAMSLDGGATHTGRNVVRVSLAAVDVLTNIDRFCLKPFDSLPPSPEDSCWRLVSDPRPGLSPSPNLTLNDYTLRLGVGPRAYTVRAWVEDAAGNPSSFVGNEGTDQVTITYEVARPPILSHLLAVSTDSPPKPLDAAARTISAGSDVFIKWNVAAGDGRALPPQPIRLQVSIDGETFEDIPGGPFAAAGNNGSVCTPSHGSGAADEHDIGCWRWENGAPSSGAFTVRAVATNSSGLSRTLSAPPLNVADRLEWLVGHTDAGIGGSAAATPFLHRVRVPTYHFDPGAFVVSSEGIVYFRDPDNGVLWVDPDDGILRRLMRISGTSSGDGGPVAEATLRWPGKLAIDFQDRLLVWDYDRIRRVSVDASGRPTRIDLLIGGGDDPTSDYIAATAVEIERCVPSGSVPSSMGDCNMNPLPNGDLYFVNRSPATHASYQGESSSDGFRIRHYVDATASMGPSITPSGTGYYGGIPSSATADMSECTLNAPVIDIDLTTGLVRRFVSYVFYDAVHCQNYGYFLGDPEGISLGDINLGIGTAYTSFARSGMDGRIYFVNTLNQPAGAILRYDPSTNTATRLVGDGSTSAFNCALGTAATSCATEAQDVFVDVHGNLYWLAHGELRSIDEEGKVTRLMGLPTSGGDGLDALSASFQDLNHFQLWNDGDDRLVLIDSGAKVVREALVGGAIDHLAGNGRLAHPRSSDPASTSPLYTTSYYNLAVDAGSGDVYMRLYDLDVAATVIARLDREADRWQALVGTNDGTPYWDASAAGVSTTPLAGNEIELDPYFDLLWGVQGGNLYYQQIRYGSAPLVGFQDSLVGAYATSDGAQVHFAGIPGATGSSCTPDGSLTPRQCALVVPYSPPTFDPIGTRWVMGTTDNRFLGLPVPPTTPASTVATPGRAHIGFAYRRDGTGEWLYLCDTVERRLFRYDVDAAAWDPSATQGRLPWPIANLACHGTSSGTMVWSASRGAVLFTYELHGRVGIAAYHDD